jgi:hypothetical protein
MPASCRQYFSFKKVYSAKNKLFIFTKKRRNKKMNKKMMSMLSLLFALSLLFSVVVSANTSGQGNGGGQGNGENQEATEQEETAEVTAEETDDDAIEDSEEVDGNEETDEDESGEDEEQEGKGKGKGKGLQTALENVKGLPSGQVIRALLDEGMDVSDVAQGLDELAGEEGETEISDEELKDLTDDLRDYVEEEELESGQELEIMSQMVDVYEEVGALDDAIEVQEDAVKKNFKDLESYKKLGKLNNKNGEKGIKAFVNGEQPNSDVAPLIKDGRTFLPFRAISNSLKADVAYDAEENSVTVTRNGIEVKLIIGSTTAYVNGQEITLDAPPTIVEGRTVVPVRLVAEAFGAIVLWESESQSIVIYEEEAVETTEDSTTETTE